jgi:uncharacterized membrane-anchored protein
MSSTAILAAAIGAKALYLMFVWLASAISASWLSMRAGYGERPGLASGLLLTVLGVVVWVVIYLALPRPHSPRAVEGIVPRRHKADERPA